MPNSAALSWKYAICHKGPAQPYGDPIAPGGRVGRCRVKGRRDGDETRRRAPTGTGSTAGVPGGRGAGPTGRVDLRGEALHDVGVLAHHLQQHLAGGAYLVEPTDDLAHEVVHQP